MSNLEVVLFPDTNILLHYPPLKDIDWLKVADAKRVKLVICRKVVDELDDKKDHSLLSDRAKRAIREIESCADGREFRPGVLLEIHHAEVRLSEFPEELTPDAPDHQIIHLFGKYEQEHKEIMGGIVTEDLGMKLRCRTSGVAIYEIDADLRLPTPRSELAKKNLRLQERIASLKARQPDLRLCAVHEGLEPRSPEPYTCEITCQYRPLDVEGLLKDAIKKYSYKMDYINKYRKYLEQRDLHRQLCSRMFTFDLFVVNSGTCPGEDIAAIIRFPEALVVNDVESEIGEWFSKGPDAPTPPRGPLAAIGIDYSRVERSIAATSNVQSLPQILSELKGDTPSVSVRTIEDGTKEVRIKVRRAGHGTPRRFGSFLAAFRTVEDVGPFEAPYELHAANQPVKKEDKLAFKVTRKAGASDGK